jgi:hypothetical protein
MIDGIFNKFLICAMHVAYAAHVNYVLFIAFVMIKNCEQPRDADFISSFFIYSSLNQNILRCTLPSQCTAVSFYAEMIHQ